MLMFKRACLLAGLFGALSVSVSQSLAGGAAPSRLGQGLNAAIDTILERTAPDASAPVTVLPSRPVPEIPPVPPATQPTTRPMRAAITLAGTTLSMPTPLIIVRYSTREPDSVTAARVPPNPVEVRLTVPEAEGGGETRSFATVIAPPDVVKGEDKWAKLIVNGRSTPLDGRTTAIDFPRSTAADSGGDVSLYVSTPEVSVTWVESADRLRIRRSQKIIDLDGGFAGLLYKAATDAGFEGDPRAALQSARDEILRLSDLDLYRAVVGATPAQLGDAATVADGFTKALLLLEAHHSIAPTGMRGAGSTVHELQLAANRTAMILVPGTNTNTRRLLAVVNLFSPDGACEVSLTLSFAPNQVKPDQLIPGVLRVLTYR